MHKSLSIDPDKCTGCLQCELACSLEHEGTFNPSKSRIKVFTFEGKGRFVPYTCTQCAEAWCLEACPTHAITMDRATGAKMVSDAYRLAINEAVELADQFGADQGYRFVNGVLDVLSRTLRPHEARPQATAAAPAPDAA